MELLENFNIFNFNKLEKLNFEDSKHGVDKGDWVWKLNYFP